MTDWNAVLRAVAPRGNPHVLDGMAAGMPDAIAEAGLNTTLRQAHFVSQCAHESDGFKVSEEYASGAAYEGRRDLGNTKPGDGRRFKGRSPIQLTGRANYTACGKDLGVDLVGDPAAAAEFPLAASVAAWFWMKRPKLNAAADRDDCEAVTKIVNGGHNGLEQRKTYLVKAKKALGIGIGDPIVQALQQALLDRCYFAVGKADGLMGHRTVGAIAAFQSANELPVNGTFDAATMAKLRDPETPRAPISPERATKTKRGLLAEGSRITKGGFQIRNLCKGGIGFGGLMAFVNGVMAKIDGAKAQVAMIQGVFEGVPAWAWGVIIVGVAVVGYLSADAILAARQHDEQVGKTS